MVFELTPKVRVVDSSGIDAPPVGCSQVLPSFCTRTSSCGVPLATSRVTDGMVSSGRRGPGTTTATPMATCAATDTATCSSPASLGADGGSAGRTMTPARYSPLVVPAGTVTPKPTLSRPPAGTVTVVGNPE